MLSGAFHALFLLGGNCSPRAMREREASKIRRAIADRSANDIAKQMTMTSKKEKVMRTREGKWRAKVTKNFSQRNTRIDEHHAVLDEPKDYAVTRGRDESLRHEGGHSPEHDTVVLENTDEQQKQQTFQTRPRRQQNSLLSTIFAWIEGTFREPSITK